MKRTICTILSVILVFLTAVALGDSEFYYPNDPEMQLYKDGVPKDRRDYYEGRFVVESVGIDVGLFRCTYNDTKKKDDSAIDYTKNSVQMISDFSEQLPEISDVKVGDVAVFYCKDITKIQKYECVETLDNCTYAKDKSLYDENGNCLSKEPDKEKMILWNDNGDYTCSCKIFKKVEARYIPTDDPDMQKYPYGTKKERNTCLFAGRFVMEDIGIDVALYSKMSQIYTDMTDSASFFHFCDSKTRYIADHKNQGFDKLYDAKVGMKAVIYTENPLGNEKFVVTRICEGIKYKGMIWDDSYPRVYASSPNGIVAYTCMENNTHVWIVFFEKIN